MFRRSPSRSGKAEYVKGREAICFPPLDSGQRFRHTDWPVALLKGEGLLATQTEQQVAFPHAAPQHHLNGLHLTGIIFRQTNYLIIGRKREPQQFLRIEDGPEPDGKSTAYVPVKRDTSFPEFRFVPRFAS